MIKSVLRKNQLFYGVVISILLILIVAAYSTIMYFYIDNKNFVHKNEQSPSYLQLKTKKQYLVLNPQMKKWLSNEQNLNRKYFKIIIKGYGSNGQIVRGYGQVKVGLRIYYVTQSQFTVVYGVLQYHGMMFGGNWQILPVTPQDYVCNVSNNYF